MADLTSCTVTATRLSYQPNGEGARANADQGDVIELTDEQVTRFTKLDAVAPVAQESAAAEPADEQAGAETGATTAGGAGGDENVNPPAGEVATGGGFDADAIVSGSVREVTEYARANPEHVDAIVEAERAGQARSTILDLA